MPYLNKRYMQSLHFECALICCQQAINIAAVQQAKGIDRQASEVLSVNIGQLSSIQVSQPS